MSEVAVRDDEAWRLALELSRNGALRPTGLYLSDPNLSYDTFEALGFMLGRAHSSLRFAIGDWLLLGEQLFPLLLPQAAEALGLSEDGMLEYVRVSQKVPRNIRHAKLSWSHHRAVAALEYPQQRVWLRRAEDDRLSHHELRDALRSGGGAPSAPQALPTPPPDVCECCGRSLG